MVVIYFSLPIMIACIIIIIFRMRSIRLLSSRVLSLTRFTAAAASFIYIWQHTNTQFAMKTPGRGRRTHAQSGGGCTNLRQTSTQTSSHAGRPPLLLLESQAGDRTQEHKHASSVLACALLLAKDRL